MKVLKDYRGRAIRLTGERLRHVLEHPEMAGLEPAIGEALARPELVVRSLADENATLNYLYMRGTSFGDKWLCVVVKYGQYGQQVDGFVLTAYLTDKPKKGEQLWPAK